MRLREDQILRSNGEKGIYGVVEKDDGAIILPIDGRQNLACGTVPLHHAGAVARAASGQLGEEMLRTPRNWPAAN